MPFVYWSACCEAFPPAGATEETGQRVQRKQEQSRIRGGRKGGTTDELGVGICCHASVEKQFERRISHGYAVASFGN